MRTVTLPFIMILTAFAVLAANPEKEYRKLIEKYDAVEEAKSVSNQPADYWKSLITYDESYKKFSSDIQKNKGAEKEALQLAEAVPHFYPQYAENIVESKNSFCDSLLHEMGIDSVPFHFELYVVTHVPFHAYTALTDNGVAICISSWLLDRKGVDRSIIKGFVAREYAHGLLCHPLRALYDEAKRDRKSSIVAGVAAGLIVGAAAVASTSESFDYDRYCYHRYHGCNVSSDNTANLPPVELYPPQFSIEHEAEADLVAYRYMTSMGMGDDYLNGLKVLSSVYNGEEYQRVSSRIGFIQYVRDHPELGNTENAKLRKKRIRKLAR